MTVNWKPDPHKRTELEGRMDSEQSVPAAFSSEGGVEGQGFNLGANINSLQEFSQSISLVISVGDSVSLVPSPHRFS